MRRTGWLLVDVLNDIVTGVLASPAAEPTVDRSGSLIEAARTCPAWTTIYANDPHHLADLEFEIFGVTWLPFSLSCLNPTS